MTRTRILAESSLKSGVSARISAKPVLVLVPDREPRPLGACDLRHLADALRALARGRTNSLHYHMEVAKRVVDEIYGGNVEAFRSEGDGPSFNELARNLQAAIKKTRLHRALWAYEVRETTPIYVPLVAPDAVPGDTGVPTLEQLILAPGVPTLERVPFDLLERLGVSHLYEVRNLATPLRSDLLSQALHARWSVRRLRREIDARTSRPERPSLSPILELLRQLGDVPATIDLTPLRALSEADTRLYQAIADKVRHLLLRSQDVLAKRVPATETT